nr:hypothetical protein [Tanacetum cinerariifolium]
MSPKIKVSLQALIPLTTVATSTTEAEYVAAASCYGQVLWIKNQLLDYGEISVLSCKYWNGESLNMSDFMLSVSCEALLKEISISILCFLNVGNKMHKAFPLPVIEFSLPKEVPTASITSDGTGKKKGRTVIVTADDMQKRKNDVKNMAFISSAKHISGNEEVNTASVSTASTNVSTASANIEVTTISQDTTCDYIASQSSGSQIKFEDINQIDEDDMEEMDIKWNMALLSMRADKFWKKISIQGTDVAGFDKSKVKCFNCHKKGHFARECRAPRSQDRGRRDNYRQGSKVEEQAPKALMAIDGNMIYHYQLGLAQVESRLAEHKDRELKYYKKIRGLEFKTESSDDYIESLKKELELIKKAKDGFQTAPKDLDNLLESQRLDKNKEGLGYSVVPPLAAQIYSLPKKDMSWAGLPEFKDDTVTDYSRPTPAIESTSDDAQNRNPSVTKTEALPSTISPKSFIKFVKANDSPTKIKTNKVKIAKKPPLNSQNNIDDKGYWDSGCSRHMTGNISYLFDYEPFNGEYVSFGQGGCKITGKGTIKTGKLEFENVYFVKDLKYNLFSVSQICDNKNSVLFTDSECIVLGQNLKLSDDDNVLLMTPRQHNMYSIDLNNIVPDKDLTCLVTKASADECMLWNRRLVTDDFSRFTWTFFLKTKDETSGILKKLITEIENLKDLKVKIIRCDNGGEFRNKEMNDFCSQKGIKREFSNARTPQQNGVAKRRNKTLIEAARTMLADAKLPVTFWAEAVNTACYDQNSVLVNKSQNKTSYELFNGRTPAIEFLKPFSYHVMILNTLDNLGKFEAKGDECYFIGYSMSSKAFRVFNKRTRRVEENLHVEFLENNAIEKGAGLNWLFDIDSLTKSMNYVPVDAGTNCINISGTKDAASQEVKKDVSSLRYIALPNWVHDALLESSSSKPQDDCSSDVPESSGNTNSTITSTNPPADELETLTVETPIPTVSLPVPTACFTDSPEPSSDARLISKRVANQVETPSLDNILTLANRFEDIFRVTTNSDESNGVEADVSNMEITITASPTPTLRIHKDHPKSQIIGPVDTPIQTRNKSKEISNALQDPSWVEAMQEELLQLKIQNVWNLVDCPKGVRPIGTKWVLKNKKDERGIVIRNKARLVAQGHTQEEGINYDEMDVKSAFLYGTIDEEVEFEALMHEKFQMSVMGELNFFFGLQVLQKEDGIFLSQDKYAGDILKKFGYSNVRSSNTPMDKENPWGKDGTGKDVDLYLYRSMIGSLMYLTASRPDIMFAVYAYARHQYPKESPFDLVAYSDSDYGGATQDHKSTTEGCQFLGRRLISWQCKKQTIVATSTTVAKHVAAASCCGQVLLGTKDAASQEVKKDVSSLRYIALPNWVHDALLESSSSKPQDDCSIDVPKSSGNSNSTATSTNPSSNQLETLTVETPKTNFKKIDSDGVEADVSNMETTITNVWTLVNCPKRVRPFGKKWVLKNKKDERGIIIRNKARLVAQGHTHEEGINYDEVFAPVARIEAIRLFLAYASFMSFTVYQMDVKSAFLYATIDEEVQRGDFILVQVYVDDIIFGSSNPQPCREFEALMHEKFPMSAMGELNFFLGLQVLQKKDGIFLSPDKLHTAKTFDLVWMWLGGDCGKVFLMGFKWDPVSEHNVDFHPIVDFVEASPLSSNIATALVCLATPSLSTLPSVTTAPIPTVTLSDTPPLRQYTRSARIAQSSTLLLIADEPASPLRDVSQGEACPTNSGFGADQDRANIAKTSTLPHDSAPRVTSPAADEGTSGVAEVSTGSRSIPTAGPPAAKFPTGSDVVPTAGPIFTTTTMIDAQVARELEEQMAREDKRMSEQIARDADIARIHAEEELVKKLKTLEEVPKDVKTPDEVPEEKVKEMMQLVPIEEVYVEALQVKHPIIDWKVHTKGQGSYWKITRLGGSSASYQFFIDMLKHLDREDLNQLWALVKESLSIRPPTSDKEMELWVELKRLYEPDNEDQSWTHTQNLMHAPVEWKLYDTCEVHHVTSKDKEIFMLVEKDYPLRKGLAIGMISYRLKLENYSKMENDLILKIYKIASSPRQQD